MSGTKVFWTYDKSFCMNFLDLNEGHRVIYHIHISFTREQFCFFSQKNSKCVFDFFEVWHILFFLVQMSFLSDEQYFLDSKAQFEIANQILSAEVENAEINPKIKNYLAKTLYEKDKKIFEIAPVSVQNLKAKEHFVEKSEKRINIAKMQKELEDIKSKNDKMEADIRKLNKKIENCRNIEKLKLIYSNIVRERREDIIKQMRVDEAQIILANYEKWFKQNSVQFLMDNDFTNINRLDSDDAILSKIIDEFHQSSYCH